MLGKSFIGFLFFEEKGFCPLRYFNLPAKLRIVNTILSCIAFEITLLGAVVRDCVRSRADMQVCVEKKHHAGCMRAHSLQGGVVRLGGKPVAGNVQEMHVVVNAVKPFLS